MLIFNQLSTIFKLIVAEKGRPCSGVGLDMGGSVLISKIISHLLKFELPPAARPRTPPPPPPLLSGEKSPHPPRLLAGGVSPGLVINEPLSSEKFS